MWVVPIFGPPMMAKVMSTPARGVPQLFVRVALTVTVVPTCGVWVACVRVSTALGHGGLPMTVHCVDSFVPSGQSDLSMPPVLRRCPVSTNVVVTSFTGTSISGKMLEFVQTPDQSVLLGPTSEV